MKKLIPLAIIILALILLGTWYYSDKKVIHRKTEALLECLEKDEDDGLLTGVLSENEFRDLLDKKVKIDFRQKDMPDIQGGIPRKRDDLARHYLYLMKSAKTIALTDKKIEIKSIKDNTALVDLNLFATINHRAHSLNKNLEILILFKKTTEGWRVNQVTVK